MISKDNTKDVQTENLQNETQTIECENCLALQNKLEMFEKDLKESKDNYLYLLADFDNYKKYTQKIFDETKEFQNEKLLFELLIFADDFDRASEIIKDEEVKKGILMIKENLAKLLNDFDVKKIDAIGKIVDPKFHEVIVTEKSDLPVGTILEELQKGYIYKNKILRYSKVKVAE